jgi:outer membrane protein assembly factor BamB
VQHSGASAGTLTRQSAYAWAQGDWGMREDWKTYAESLVQAGAAVDRAGRVYVGVDNSRVYAFNASNGALIWYCSGAYVPASRVSPYF